MNTNLSSEHSIQNQIRVAISADHCTIFRANVGSIRLPDGRWFDTGLPKGYPDLYGFRHIDHQIFFIEVKNATGRIRPDQVKFHEFLQKFSVIHGIARSVSDAKQIVEKGLVGYGYLESKK